MANPDLFDQASRITRFLERMARWKRPATGIGVDRYWRLTRARFERASGLWARADEAHRRRVLTALADAHRRFPRPPSYPYSAGFVRFLADVARSDVSDELALDAFEAMRAYLARDLRNLLTYLDNLDVPIIRMLVRVRDAARAAGRPTLALEANEFLFYGDHWLAAAAAKVELLVEIDRRESAQKFADDAVQLLETQGKYEDLETLHPVLQRALGKPRAGKAATSGRPPEPTELARRRRNLELSEREIVLAWEGESVTVYHKRERSELRKQVGRLLQALHMAREEDPDRLGFLTKEQLAKPLGLSMSEYRSHPGLCDGRIRRAVADLNAVLEKLAIPKVPACDRRRGYRLSPETGPIRLG